MNRILVAAAVVKDMMSTAEDAEVAKDISRSRKTSLSPGSPYNKVKISLQFIILVTDTGKESAQESPSQLHQLDQLLDEARTVSPQGLA